MTDFTERIVVRECKANARHLEERLEGTEQLLHAVEAELMRYERRSALLMLKEFCYQKVMCPLADTLLPGEKARGAVHNLYRKVHPRRDGEED